MVVESTGTQAAGGGVIGAIRNAAQATGTSFQYLLATAQVESGLNPNASVASSSAKGLFQFIDQTWLSTLKTAGSSLGYGRYADAIVRSSSGRYEVPDPAMRSAIFALRNDPAANAAMAGAFTQANAALLTEKLGRAPSEGDLYVAHFLGASGAARLITLAANNPNASAAALFPHAARANSSIFYDRQGRARSIASVYNTLVGRYDVARASPAAAPLVAANVPATRVASAPMQSSVSVDQVLSATPATQGGQPVFHSLFSDDSKRGPVSQFIRDLWTTRPQVAAALSGQQLPPSAVAPASAPGAPLDLFSDQPSDVKALFGVRS
jgi:hypothetical protein